MDAAVYLRISEDRLGLELGVERQREDCWASAAARHCHDVVEFMDNDISATRGAPRPGYRALLTAVEAGEVKQVIIWHQSRLWRNRRERAEGIEILRKAGVRLIAVKGPELDMSTAAGRGLAGLLGEFDTMESEVKSERIAREVRQRAEQGRYSGGPRAYGYTADGMHLEPAEAGQLARWYGELLAGRSITAIAREAGKHHSSMRCMIKNPRNAGLRVLDGTRYAGGWPAIVPEETWAAAVALLGDPNRRTNVANVARRWLGAGLYGCERCDGRPVASFRGGYGRKAYKCLPARGGCGRQWAAERLDAWIVDLVTARLKRDDLEDLLPRDRPDLTALSGERAAARKRLVGLAEEWAADELTDEQLRAATAKLKARIAQIDGIMADAGRIGALGALLATDNPAAAWLAIPAEQVDRRQAVVRALMTVRLDASPRGRAPFDPLAFISVKWRGRSSTVDDQAA